MNRDDRILTYHADYAGPCWVGVMFVGAGVTAWMAQE